MFNSQPDWDTLHKFDETEKYYIYLSYADIMRWKNSISSGWTAPPNPKTYDSYKRIKKPVHNTNE